MSYAEFPETLYVERMKSNGERQAYNDPLKGCPSGKPTVYGVYRLVEVHQVAWKQVVEKVAPTSPEAKP